MGMSVVYPNGPCPVHHGHPFWVTSCTLDALSNPGWAPCGICTGDHGASQACPYGARSNPGARPVKSCDRPRTGFDWALWVCPIKSRTGPSRGRYLRKDHGQILIESAQQFPKFKYLLLQHQILTLYLKKVMENGEWV